MRILLTGVSGQVGAALLPRLQSIGSVTSPDSKTLDLAKPDLLCETLDRIAPQLIINPAAYTAVDQAEADPGTASAVNSTAPGIIARWAAAHDAPLIHFSTDYVFSGSGKRPWRENDEPEPCSIYGLTKLAGDRAVEAAGGSHLIVRTSWVYAAHGKNFFRTIARLAQERKELRVVADQIGAPTSASLIADAVIKIVAGGNDHLRRFCSSAHGVVHLTASGETSWHGFASSIVDGLRQRGVGLAVEKLVAIRSVEYQTQARRPYNSRLDLSRWHQLSGYIPPNWEVALAPVLDEFACHFRSEGASEYEFSRMG